MISKVKDFSKGQAVTVETGGRPQADERSIEKATDKNKPTTEDLKSLKDNVRE
ncbi:MAG: hypothetical protein AB7U85_01330 [Alphaproteobacteria bacterium]